MAFSSFEEDAGSEAERAWQEARAQGLRCFRAGQHEQAEELFTSAIELARQVDPQDARVARSLGELAELRRRQGDLEGAELLVKQSLEIFESRGQHFHPDIVPSLNNLAGLYYAQGRHPMADALYRRALQIWDETGQPPHSRLVPVLYNLATMCQERQDHSEAARLMERACETADLVWGNQHPDSLRCRRAYQDLLLSGAGATRQA